MDQKVSGSNPLGRVFCAPAFALTRDFDSNRQ